MRNQVFVGDANSRNALPIIRSLGRRGISVVGGDCVPIGLCRFSRYCRRWVTYPDFNKDKDKFISFLLRLFEAQKFELFIPINQDILLEVARHKKSFERVVRVAIPEYEVIYSAVDKSYTLKAALRTGVPIPKTIFIESLSNLDIALRNVQTPVVIKPRISAGSRGLIYVTDARELRNRYLEIHEGYPFPLIQERLPSEGEGQAVGVLMDRDSKVLQTFCYRRLREFPISGGPSTLRESMHAPYLRQLAIRLLSEMKWYGIAMVEFKVDIRDNCPKLMEVNPRFWGSLQLAISTGIDFPSLFYDMAMGNPQKEDRSYRSGVKCRWFLPGDILHFLLNPRRFHLEPGFFSFDRDTHYDILSLEDPLPIAGMGIMLLRDQFVSNGWRGFRRNSQR